MKGGDYTNFKTHPTQGPSAPVVDKPQKAAKAQKVAKEQEAETPDPNEE